MGLDKRDAAGGAAMLVFVKQALRARSSQGSRLEDCRVACVEASGAASTQRLLAIPGMQRT